MKQRNKEQKRKVHSIRGQFAWIFIGLMINTLVEDPVTSIIGLAVPALGFVCYHFFRWYNSRQSA